MVSTTPPKELIRLDDIRVRFMSEDSETVALDGASLAIDEGEFVAVIGPSGCGKSTLLGLIAGLRSPENGRVLYRGQPLTGPNHEVGFVTQQDNLLPWRTVAGNVELALGIRGIPARKRAATVREMLERVGLDGFAGHYPSELSGGMRKRVTLARTLIYRPEALLLDEPFGALDAQLRLTLQAQLLDLWAEMHSTVMFVTHDLEEAVLLADRVIVLSARPGRVKLDRAVDFPRPRKIDELRFEPEFRKLYSELWRELGSELPENV